MQFKTVLVSALSVLFAGQTMGAALTAIDADSACRCPNNCSHHLGSSCAYKAGSSTDGSTINGSCQNGNGGLTCIPK
ncbi:hypothetical protein F4820DRAFT_443859 [Hypoxylon rubiginosum]|uniref:Uncharacterized protein n=1 Tax=Hypoxylon rubiginosum TaxID=110542 RepID=A0ACB9ZDT7_9PEZI|nr:hypothetical protein F4820DRAFT_443859 [Hypoxylon rubiginosum]